MSEAPTRQRRRLAGFTGRGYDVGRSPLWRVAWLVVQTTVFMRWWMPAKLRVALLRAFGADIADGVLIRHRVRIHWPWKLTIGKDSWVGEGAWLLNLEPIVLGSDVCISQDVLLCTGSHDRRSPTFEFDNGPIHVGSGAWVAARAIVLRGVTIGEDALVGAGVTVRRDVEAGATVVADR